MIILISVRKIADVPRTCVRTLRKFEANDRFLASSRDHGEEFRLVTKRMNHRDAIDSDLRDGRVMGSGEIVAEALVLMAAGLTWLDHLPRALALRLYPADLIDPLPLASIWPSSHVGTIGVISFWSTGVFLLLAWMRSGRRAWLVFVGCAGWVCWSWSTTFCGVSVCRA